MSKKVTVQEEVSPNLIPMIDIMFLLLLFFMLSADMSQRELEEVILPKAKSVKEDKTPKGSEAPDRLMLNIYHIYPNEVACARYAKGEVCREEKHWRMGVKGTDYTQPEKLETLLKAEAAMFRTDLKNPKISDRMVMIRADASAPYGLVQRSMNVCAKAGIYKIECGAARPPEEGPPPPPKPQPH